MSQADEELQWLKLWRDVPEDCRELVLKAFPHLVAVMGAGAKNKSSGAWRQQGAGIHLLHAHHHGLAANVYYRELPRDEQTGEFHRAHQALRVLMALGKELGL